MVLLKYATIRAISQLISQYHALTGIATVHEESEEFLVITYCFMVSTTAL